MDRPEIAGLLERVRLLRTADEATDARLMATLIAPAGAYAAVSQFNGRWVVYSGDDRRGFPKPFEVPNGFRQDGQAAFTASIDAALALLERVLPGCLIDLRRTQTGWFARLSPVDRLAKCDPCATGPSGALSLCAALLTAIPGGSDADR